MKGVVLAGGLGTRLFPLTKVTNKHLLPIYQKPMIYYPIQALVEAGVRDIMIVTGGNHAGAFLQLLGNGREFGLDDLAYTYQEGEKGIAHALALTEHFAGGDPIMVLLGDNLFERSLRPAVEAFARQKRGARVLLKKVAYPERFGVPVLKKERIIRIEEKPKKPRSPFAVTGVYFYDSRVYDVIRRLNPSQRGEYEITDVNNWYLKRGELEYSLVQGWWTDAGTFDSLLLANLLVMQKECRDFSSLKTLLKEE